MQSFEFTGESLPAGKINTELLRGEVASALGIGPEKVGVAFTQGGGKTTSYRLKRGPEGTFTEVDEAEQAPTLQVYAPEQSDKTKIADAVKAHAPTEDDGELLRKKDKQARADDILSILKENLPTLLSDPKVVKLLKEAVNKGP